MLEKKIFQKFLHRLETMQHEKRQIEKTVGVYEEWFLDRWIDNYYDLFIEVCNLHPYTNQLISWWCGYADFGKYTTTYHDVTGRLTRWQFEIKDSEALYKMIVYFEGKLKDKDIDPSLRIREMVEKIDEWNKKLE